MELCTDASPSLPAGCDSALQSVTGPRALAECMLDMAMRCNCRPKWFFNFTSKHLVSQAGRLK
jgi:hypothetical protein